LRTIISENQHEDNIYARAANGSFPLVIHAENEVDTPSLPLWSLLTNILLQYDITQLIKIKQDFESLNLVIFGGAGTPLVSTLIRGTFPYLIAFSKFRSQMNLPRPKFQSF
jgi:hypothetical protein